MLKRLILIVATILCCRCDRPDTVNYNIHKIKPGHHYHDPYYHHLLYGGGLLSYLTFVAIKVKVLFVLGAFFTFFLFAGKLYALIKFGEYMKVHHEPEKIYVQSPNHHYEPDYRTSSIPGGSVFPDIGDHYQDLDRPPGVVATDKFFKPIASRPIKPIIYSMASRPPRSEPGGRSLVATPQSSNNYDTSLYQYFCQFSNLIKTVNLTDIIFTRLGVSEESYRKQWIRRLERFAQGNWMLESGLAAFSDETYSKYKAAQQNVISEQDWHHLDKTYCM